VLSVAAWSVTLLLQYAPRRALQAAWIGVPALALLAFLAWGLAKRAGACRWRRRAWVRSARAG